MNCPFCKSNNTSVIDSRDTYDGIRRRRQCENCGQRFTTYERLMANAVVVVKRDGRREEFNRQKLADGIRKACSKRPAALAAIDDMVVQIEADIQRLNKPELPSRYIGELVMDKLKEIDQVAYVRFASVYREFKGVNSFRELIETLNRPPAAATTGKRALVSRARPLGQLALLPAMEVSVEVPKREESNRRKGRIRGPMKKTQAPLKPVPDTR